MNLKEKITGGLIVLAIVLIAITGFEPQEEKKEKLGFAPTSGYDETLTVSLGISETTINVSSVDDTDGYDLDLSTSNTGYFSIDPGTDDVERVACTGISGSTLTNCTRGLTANGENLTSSSTLIKEHDVGARIVMSNIGQFFSNYVNIWDDQEMAGQKTFSLSPKVSSSTVQNQTTSTTTLATIEYVNNTATSGAANLSETVKGLAEGATQLEMASSTEFGGTGASLVLLSKYATSSPQVTGKYLPVCEDDGYLNQNWFDLTENWSFSGDVALASTTFNASTTWNVLPEYDSDPIGDNEAVRKSYVDNGGAGIINLVASDNLKASADDNVSTSDTSYAKVKEIRVNIAGTIRVKVDLKPTFAGDSSFGRVYIDGVAVGTEHEATDHTQYVTYTDTSINVKAGEFVQLYMKKSGGDPALGKNFRLYADKDIVDDFEIITN